MRLVLLAVAALSAACSAKDSRPPDDAAAADADAGAAEPNSLIGTWTYTQSVSPRLSLTLMFDADLTFAFSQHQLPGPTPASMPSPETQRILGCVVTNYFSGIYTISVERGMNVLTWDVEQAAANVVTGCDDPSSNEPGVSLTADSVRSNVAEGKLPPNPVTYRVSEQMLVLISPSYWRSGIGQEPGTAFTRSAD